MSLIIHTKKGLYCPIAKVYIDPSAKVDNALITHGHSDHARWGHKYYVCTQPSVPILKHRLGHSINVRGLAFGETLSVNGVDFSFHPAGHITGSAQVRAAYKGEVWVVSGDYKLEDDHLCTPYESVMCHHFITECTFGLPVYRWPKQEEVIAQIKAWWMANAAEGRTSVVTAYSLGKAQRLVHSLGDDIGPIYTHSSIDKMNQVYRRSGIDLPDTHLLTPDCARGALEKALILTPTIANNISFERPIKDYSVGVASGWMAIHKHLKRRTADIGFVLSDHCDWDGLNQAIKATGANHIYPTHGNTASFARWLNEQGYDARPIETASGEGGIH